MDIKPIKTEGDYQAALEEIDYLFDAQPNTPEGDRLEVLATLVEAYEERQHDIPSPDPIEAILYHPLFIDMIRKLHKRLGISAEVLSQPYDLDKSAA